MDYEQEERELWGYKFKATAQEDREIRRKFNKNPIVSSWRVTHLQVMHGRFDPLSEDGWKLCEELRDLEERVEDLALALIEEHERGD